MKLIVLTVFIIAALVGAQEIPDYAYCVADHQPDIDVCAADFELCNPFTESTDYTQDLPIQEYCGCFTELLRCLCDVCPNMQAILDEWQASMTQFCSEWTWTITGCYFQLYNDPHLMRLGGENGTWGIRHTVCNQENFPDIYTTSTMQVSGTAAGGDGWSVDGATSMQSVTVVVGGATFTHTVSSPFSGTAPAGVTVSPHRISVRDTGESVSVTVNSAWINVEIYGKCQGTSLVHVGCANPGAATDKKRATHPECDSLAAEYRDACNYDLDATNGDTAWVNASVHMSTKMNAAQLMLTKFAETAHSGSANGGGGGGAGSNEINSAWAVSCNVFVTALVAFVLAML